MVLKIFPRTGRTSVISNTQNNRVVSKMTGIILANGGSRPNGLFVVLLKNGRVETVLSGCSRHDLGNGGRTGGRGTTITPT